MPPHLPRARRGEGRGECQVCSSPSRGAARGQSSGLLEPFPLSLATGETPRCSRVGCSQISPQREGKKTSVEMLKHAVYATPGRRGQGCAPTPASLHAFSVRKWHSPKVLCVRGKRARVCSDNGGCQLSLRGRAIWFGRLLLLRFLTAASLQKNCGKYNNAREGV